MTLSAREIIDVYSKDKLSARPEFYAGRGNTYSDLDSRILELVYDGVKKEIGVPAAKAFANMVNEMTGKNDASATTFLLSLYRLEANGWQKATPVGEAEGLAEIASKAHQDNDKQAMAAVQYGIAHLFGRMGAETEDHSGIPALSITGIFLLTHQDEIDGDIAPSPTPWQAPSHDF